MTESKMWIAAKDDYYKFHIKPLEKLLEKYEYPDLSTAEEYRDFMYLRACLYMGVKPMGDFEGNAKICAEVMSNGGDIVEMHRAGAGAVYCACLSHHKLEVELQKAIIDHHIPF